MLETNGRTLAIILTLFISGVYWEALMIGASYTSKRIRKCLSYSRMVGICEERLFLTSTRHLKPGGYIEQVEISIDMISDDGTIKPHSAVCTFSEARVVAFHTYWQLHWWILSRKLAICLRN